MAQCVPSRQNKQTDLINARMMQRVKIMKNIIFTLPELAARTRNSQETGRSRGALKINFVVRRFYEALGERCSFYVIS
jgi:hypothetical protein